MAKLVNRKKKIRISIIIGTRPEIIKMSPIIRECRRLHLDYFILHTGQHYSYIMDQVFFKQLELPKPKYNLDVGSHLHAQQTGMILGGVEKVLVKEKPNIVLVEGDTNSVLAGALAATKLNIKVGHIEAGLRSYDHKMPEEINRILTDHCSDFLFAPTEKSRQILLNEGILDKKIFVTGNTIVDAVHQNLALVKKKTNIVSQLKLKRRKYFLVTIHRQENVDDRHRFDGILKGLKKIHEEYNIPVIYPIHPHARLRLYEFDLNTEGITIIKPLDYLSFLQLEQDAKVVLTDSGGVQEETCILGIPCVTLRDNTERPETIDVGSNVLSGTLPKNIVTCVAAMYKNKRRWSQPYGDGKTGKRIIKILKEKN